MKPRKKSTLEVVTKAKTRRNRYLLADGTSAPGVTTVQDGLSKPAMLRWSNKIGLAGYELDKYVDELASIGTLAHSMIEKHLLGGFEDETDFPDFTKNQYDRSMVCYQKYLDWEKQHTIKVICCEKQLVSEVFKFGGTSDAILEVDGRIELFDFKTSKAIYDDHLIQCAANTVLAEENGYTIGAFRVLQIGRSPDEGFSEKVVTYDKMGKYWNVFKAALDVYYAKKEMEKSEEVSGGE